MTINPKELDKWITGNYGEDQFLGPYVCEICGEEFKNYTIWEEHDCPEQYENETTN